MNQYNAIEEQPVLETRNKSPSTSISKIVAVSVLASFALGACAATGGGVRNINVQAEMSGNAKITVVGEVSGSITVASMSGNAKIEAGSCAKPTTKTGTITGSAAITGTGC